MSLRYRTDTLILVPHREKRGPGKEQPEPAKFCKGQIKSAWFIACRLSPALAQLPAPVLGGPLATCPLCRPPTSHIVGHVSRTVPIPVRLAVAVGSARRVPRSGVNRLGGRPGFGSGGVNGLGPGRGLRLGGVKRRWAGPGGVIRSGVSHGGI